MFSPIKIDRNNRMIILNSAFARKADLYNTQEYAMLQECRKDYPDFKVMTRRIKTNPEKEAYKGLTYSFMETYIMSHDRNPQVALYELSEMKLQTQCHSRRYPIVKKWFLKKYPEIVEFGISETEYIETVEAA